MKAGKLDRRISIVREEYEPGDNPWNRPILKSSEVTQTWAEVINSSTSLYFKEHHSFANGVVVFRIRHFDGLTLTDLVEWEGRRFQIREITPIGRREGLELRCQAA